MILKVEQFKKIGKIFMSVFAIIGAFATILTIKEKLESPKVDLTANMWQAEYELPLEIVKEFYKYLSKTMTGKEQEIDLYPEKPQTTPFGILQPKDVKFFTESEDVNQYYFVQITNHGDTTARDVSLAIPYIEFSRISTRASGRGELKFFPRSSLIEIPDIRPRETVNLEIWGDGPNFPRQDLMSLTYSNGVGKIRIEQRIEPGKLFWASRKFSIICLISFIFILAILVLIIFKQRIPSDMPHRSESNSP
jgi:hypothetical protein